MRAQLGGFLRRDLGQRFEIGFSVEDSTAATICSESHSEEQVLAIIAKRPSRCQNDPPRSEQMLT